MPSTLLTFFNPSLRINLYLALLLFLPALTLTLKPSFLFPSFNPSLPPALFLLEYNLGFIYHQTRIRKGMGQKHVTPPPALDFDIPCIWG